MVTVGAAVSLWLEVVAGSLSAAELAGLKQIAETEVSGPIGAWPIPVSPLDLEWHWACRAARGVRLRRIVAAQLMFDRVMRLACVLGLEDL